MTEKQFLPNSSTVLVLGILSIPFGLCCYSFIGGLIMAIIALILASKPMAMYKENTNFYYETAYKNLNAGRICAIIGLVISGLWFLGLLFYLILWGAILGNVLHFSFEEIFNHIP